MLKVIKPNASVSVSRLPRVPDSMAHPERRRVMEEEAERQRDTIRQLAREDARLRGDTYVDPFGGNPDIPMSQ